MKLLVLLVAGVWIGMLIGISFVEAPLKFQAPNITLPLGLGIGKLVFSALNKFEIIFSIALTIWLVMQFKSLEFWAWLPMVIVITAVFIQSIWLLPILAERADAWINGMEPAKSNHHFYYVAFEVVKLVLLFPIFIKTYSYEGHQG